MPVGAPSSLVVLAHLAILVILLLRLGAEKPDARFVPKCFSRAVAAVQSSTCRRCMCTRAILSPCECIGSLARV
jgi:hypothetical protein